MALVDLIAALDSVLPTIDRLHRLLGRFESLLVLTDGRVDALRQTRNRISSLVHQLQSTPFLKPVLGQEEAEKLTVWLCDLVRGTRDEIFLVESRLNTLVAGQSETEQKLDGAGPQYFVQATSKFLDREDEIASVLSQLRDILQPVAWSTVVETRDSCWDDRSLPRYRSIIEGGHNADNAAERNVTPSPEESSQELRKSVQLVKADTVSSAVRSSVPRQDPQDFDTVSIADTLPAYSDLDVAPQYTTSTGGPDGSPLILHYNLYIALYAMPVIDQNFYTDWGSYAQTQPDTRRYSQWAIQIGPGDQEQSLRTTSMKLLDGAPARDVGYRREAPYVNPKIELNLASGASYRPNMLARVVVGRVRSAPISDGHQGRFGDESSYYRLHPRGRLFAIQRVIRETVEQLLPRPPGANQLEAGLDWLIQSIQVLAENQLIDLPSHIARQTGRNDPIDTDTLQRTVLEWVINKNKEGKFEVELAADGNAWQPRVHGLNAKKDYEVPVLDLWTQREMAS